MLHQNEVTFCKNNFGLTVPISSSQFPFFWMFLNRGEEAAEPGQNPHKHRKNTQTPETVDSWISNRRLYQSTSLAILLSFSFVCGKILLL